LIACLLRDARIDPRTHEHMALLYATESGNVTIVERLLRHERAPIVQALAVALDVARYYGQRDVMVALHRHYRTHYSDEHSTSW